MPYAYLVICFFSVNLFWSYADKKMLNKNMDDEKNLAKMSRN